MKRRKNLNYYQKKIARYKKKIRDSGTKGPVLEQNEENKFKNMEKEANEILLKQNNKRTDEEKKKLKTLQDKISRYRKKIRYTAEKFNIMSLEEKIQKKATADKKRRNENIEKYREADRKRKTFGHSSRHKGNRKKMP